MDLFQRTSLCCEKSNKQLHQNFFAQISSLEVLIGNPAPFFSKVREDGIFLSLNFLGAVVKKSS